MNAGRGVELNPEGLKMNDEPRTHLEPISRQAVNILMEPTQLTGKDEFVFPGIHHKNQPISEGTINAALLRLGYEPRGRELESLRAHQNT